MINVDAIKYLDSDRVEQTWDANKYKVSSTNEITNISPRHGEVFPTAIEESCAVSVEYTAGYATAAEVPGAMVQAMLLIIGHMYECREDSVKQLPTRAEWLLTPCKTFA